ncbi:MAG TPA: HEAT repeat domain-containing protein [Clostridiaceae bacterium]|jgi:HEAT repeat protein|nr:HEAT repeat domain-containing protein [Clostridiaceae bacterium]
MGISVSKVEKWAKKKKTAKLVKFAESDDKDIRVAIAKGLGTIETEDSANGLVNMLRDPDPDVRIAAAESLGTVGNSRSIEFVRYIVNNDTDENVRKAAGEALNRLKEKINKELLAKK